MVYIVHSLNYCCVEYYYVRATHSLRMSYEVVTIVVRKNYITLRLRYDTIRNLFLTRTVRTSYKALHDFEKIFLMEAIHLPFHPKTHPQIHYNL